MKTFEFRKSDKQLVVAQFNAVYDLGIDDVLALSVIERYWLCDKVFVFKLYSKYSSVYALFYRNKSDISLLKFDSVREAYRFILY